MASKTTIVITEVDGEFTITAENEQYEAKFVVTNPQAVFAKLLSELGIKGKRGRKKGQLNKPKDSVMTAIALVAAEVVNAD